MTSSETAGPDQPFLEDTARTIERLRSRLAAQEAILRRVRGERDTLRLALDHANSPDRLRLLAARYPVPARIITALIHHLLRLRTRLIARRQAIRLRNDPVVQAVRPFFDPAFYIANAKHTGQSDPLLHWLDYGLQAGLPPNPFFDPPWYSRTYGLPPGENAVQHYAIKGAALRYDPSPAFATGYYLDHYPDVVDRGENPLAHYLAHGQREGRSPRPPGPDALPASIADITAVIPPRAGAEVALFVTHSPDGKLAPHVIPYLTALAEEGIATTLIVATDHAFAPPALLAPLLDGLYVRQNTGWDFAAWSHVLQLNPHFFGADILFWLNDSVIGPFNAPAFRTVLKRIRASAADLVGLTDSRSRGNHLQSYFLAFKPACLRSVAFTRFVAGVRCLKLKEDVINAYEVTLATRLRAAGLQTEVLFPSPNATDHNRTITDWQSLLDEGFPFLKRAVTASQPAWRQALAARGYDLGVAEPLPSGSMTVLKPRTPPQVAFIGPFNYANGLGVAARGYLRALANTGLTAATMPIERPFHFHAQFAPALACTPPGRPDIVLVHLNPEAWGPLLTPAQETLIAAARHRVGLFVWESNVLPPEFARRTQGLDAVWVPSHFCAEAFRPVSEAPVHVLPYVVPVRPRPPRQHARGRLTR